MDVRRLRAGEWILGLAGIGLLVSLFLPWYGGDVAGWEALSVIDVVLALIAAFAVAIPIVTASQRVPAVPLALEGLAVPAGLVATILVLIRVLWPPDGLHGREWALWLALASTLAILVGAWIAMGDERTSKPGRPTDASGAPAEPEPLPDPIPAPPRIAG